MTVSPAIIQAAASTRTAPSREFMVQQAVLDFLAEYTPEGLRGRGVRGQLLWILRELSTAERSYLHGMVLKQYRRIAAQYQVSP